MLRTGRRVVAYHIPGKALELHAVYKLLHDIRRICQGIEPILSEGWLQMVSDYVLLTGVGVVRITHVEIFPDGILQPVVQIVSYTDCLRLLTDPAELYFSYAAIPAS